MPSKAKSAEWYASILDAFEEFVLVKGERSRLLWANRSFCEYYGLSNEVLASLIDAEHSDPDDTLQYVRDDHHVWTTGKPMRVFEPITRHDGDVAYFETVKRAVQHGGKTVLTVGISRPTSGDEATHATVLRDERKDSSQVLRSFVASFPAAVVVVDAKLRVVAASSAFSSLLGRTDGLEGAEVESLLAMEPEVQESVFRAIIDSAPLSLSDVAVLGGERLFDLKVAPWQVSDGHALGVMITLTEVTELRASERRLETERKALQSIIDVMDVGVATLDDEGEFALWNPAATRLTGIDAKSERVGAETFDRQGAAVLDSQMPLARAFRGERVDHEVVNVRGENRTERWLTVSAAPVEGANGHSAVGVYTDITRRIEIQRELEEFAYVASHDLQEPLRMVRSYVGLLDDEYREQLQGDAAVYMHYIRDGADRMQRLVRDLLDFSQVRKRELTPEPTNLEEVIEVVKRVLGGTIKEKNASIESAPLPTILADRAQMTRLFENLLSNALKFSREGVAPKILLRAAEEGDGWRFEVEDNGIGIAPSYSRKVFEMFHRLDPGGTYPGTGIGLAICKRVVSRHGGTIGLGTKEGDGASFWVRLPKTPLTTPGGLW